MAGGIYRINKCNLPAARFMPVFETEKRLMDRQISLHFSNAKQSFDVHNLIRGSEQPKLRKKNEL